MALYDDCPHCKKGVIKDANKDRCPKCWNELVKQEERKNLNEKLLNANRRIK